MGFFCCPLPYNLPPGSSAPNLTASAKRELFGWVCGDQKGPSIFLNFKYVNKQDALMSNMALKIVYVYNIKSYEQFKFQIWKI